MIAERYSGRGGFFGKPADSQGRDVLERAIEVPMAQFARVRLHYGRLMPTYVVSVIAAAVIATMVVLVGSAVVVVRHRASIVVTMDVRAIPPAVAMINRAHQTKSK